MLLVCSYYLLVRGTLYQSHGPVSACMPLIIEEVQSSTTGDSSVPSP